MIPFNGISSALTRQNLHERANIIRQGRDVERIRSGRSECRRYGMIAISSPYLLAASRQFVVRGHGIGSSLVMNGMTKEDFRMTHRGISRGRDEVSNPFRAGYTPDKASKLKDRNGDI